MSNIPLRAIPDKYDKHYARIENAGSVPTPFGENYVALTGHFGPYSAHLFAAAPDLLEACKRYVAQIDAMLLSDDDVSADMRAAIAKATGGAA